MIRYLMLPLLATLAAAQPVPVPPKKFDVQQDIEKIRNTDDNVGGFRAEYKTLTDIPANPSLDSPRPPAIGVEPLISAQRLGHKPPKQARNEYSTALRYLQKQKLEEAVRHLTKALQLDPQYLQAHAELGVAHMGLGQGQPALEEFERALAIEPNSGLLHFDRAWALLSLLRPDEAEREARRSLQLNPGDPGARYLIGLAMIIQGRVTPEATEHLRAASGKYAQARIALDWIQAGSSSPRW